MKRILLQIDKHWTAYYDVSTPEKDRAAKLDVFRTMLENGYYGDMEDPELVIEWPGIRGKMISKKHVDMTDDDKVACVVSRGRDYEYEELRYESLIDATETEETPA